MSLQCSAMERLPGALLCARVCVVAFVRCSIFQFVHLGDAHVRASVSNLHERSRTECRIPRPAGTEKANVQQAGCSNTLHPH